MTRLLVLTLLLPLAIMNASTAAAAASPVRATPTTGAVEGAVAPSGIRTFKGIPYAAAPVGDLRWKAPQPHARWSGVRKADNFGPRCMQLPLFSDMVFRSNGMSEDCLYLNVWTPAADAKARLPVLVYFYGGGFQAGDGSEPRYDGESMARQGIVALTVNYRVGVFGFFAHPELSAESPHKASGNYGLLDQAAALQWVRANIAAFGGDPARVTIAGESAGSYSVSAQMASPLSRHLIAGAIGESGSLMGLSPLPTLRESEQKGLQFAERAGAASLAHLRALPPQALLDALGKDRNAHFSANVDGYLLPEAPGAIYAGGKQAKVPLLAGWNAEEGSAGAILGAGDVSEQRFMTALHGLYGEHATDARRAYAGDIAQAARELASDRFIGFGTWKWLELHARTSGQPVYRYYYTHPRPGTQGATHSAEIEYALGNLDGNKVFAWTAADHEVSRHMQAYFANFIKTGNPNGTGLAAWPALKPGATHVMTLDQHPHVALATDTAHHSFHDRLRESSRQR
jgi:para-nitrobenzyl esterase